MFRVWAGATAILSFAALGLSTASAQQFPGESKGAGAQPIPDYTFGVDILSTANDRAARFDLARFAPRGTSITAIGTESLQATRVDTSFSKITLTTASSDPLQWTVASTAVSTYLGGYATRPKVIPNALSPKLLDSPSTAYFTTQRKR
jgi:hypothetical protein